MSTRLNPICSFVLIALVAGLLAAGGLSAPGPKDAPPIKTPDGGVAAEPAGGDEDTRAKAHDESANNLKRIVLAVHNYLDEHNGELPRNVTDKDGKVLLSWRVELLPYLEEAELYKAFKRDEPWDSETNKKLLARMPKVFANPRVKVKEGGHTVYQGFAGPGTVLEAGHQIRLPDITDGTSNTLFAVEASVAFPWTRPLDLPFDEKKDLPEFGKAYGNKPLGALCDGSVRNLDLNRISAITLKAAITRSGGEVLGSDW